jgi:Fuc2NAc and GlcNAc transferase
VSELSSVVLVGVLAFVASAALQRPFIRYAERAMLDRPNARSSHFRPTPRGGGAVLVGVYLILTALTFGIGGRLAMSLILALAAILLVAGVGWLDDRRSLSVPTRLVAHVVAGLLMIPVALHLRTSVPAVLAAVLTAGLTVVSINVLNFVDGIDGLITSQVAIFATSLLLHAPTAVVGMHSSILLGAAAGFLVWNWPPARIFLGDVGSGALGAACAFAGILASTQIVAGPWVVYLPLIPIFLDASVTLVRRALRGEHLATAHRQHLYQRLANGGWGHRRVTLTYGAASLAALPVTLAGPHFSAGVGYVLLVLLAGWMLDRRYPIFAANMHSPASASDRQ